jgi:glycosyltransferase involved in cell wall biosynthesis
LNRERLLELYRQSDVSIAHVGSSPTIDATMIPIKLFEYMAASKPIIYAGKGGAAELLRKIGCVVTVTPEDRAATSIAIAELLRDPERMRVLEGRVRFRVWSDSHRDKLMERLVSALKERFADGPDA